MVPTFTSIRSTREVPSYTPAASPQVRRRLSPWPPRRPIHSGYGVARPWSMPGVHGRPTQIRQVRVGSTLTKLHALVPHVHLLVLLAGPAPSGSTRASRRCQDCSRPHRRLPDQAVLSFTRLLRQPSGQGLSPRLGTLAPRGARTDHRTGGPHRAPPNGAAWPASAVPAAQPRTSPARSAAHWYSPAPPVLAVPHLRESAGPLRHVRGFPAPGLLRVLRPAQWPSADDAPSRPRPPGRRAGRGPPAVPTFTTSRSTGEAASSAPAASPRLRRRHSPWPPGRPCNPGPGVPRLS